MTRQKGKKKETKKEEKGEREKEREETRTSAIRAEHQQRWRREKGPAATLLHRKGGKEEGKKRGKGELAGVPSTVAFQKKKGKGKKGREREKPRIPRHCVFGKKFPSVQKEKKGGGKGKTRTAARKWVNKAAFAGAAASTFGQ